METRSLKKKNNFWYDKMVSVTNEIWATAQLWPQKLIMILTIVVQKISESNTYFRKWYINHLHWQTIVISFLNYVGY